MSILLLEGRLAAEKLLENLREQRAKLSSTLRSPKLCAILIGDHPASKIYVQAKVKACEKMGYLSEVIYFSADVQKEIVQKTLQKLNQNSEVDGILLQLPLPQHLSALELISQISIHKDVDGFHPENLGRMLLQKPYFLPATTLGIIALLNFYQIETAGKHCVVVGRSSIVGLPTALWLAQKQEFGNCTVTLTHSYTKNLKNYTEQADILISAVGKPHHITADMVKKNAVVIDVGISRKIDENGKNILLGDVDFVQVSKIAQAITPVPGGVGPMTIYGLLHNTFQAYRQSIGIFP